MKCSIPEISWHNRDPILSLDFQPSKEKRRRLATCGTDTHVMIWLVLPHANGSISLEFRADLTRHTKSVNVVRFSNTGELLASGDDEANIILWKQAEKRSDDIFDDSVENKENWVAHKVLRGHIDDICDVCWSPSDCFLASGSIDNTCIIWDVGRGKNVGILKENKGFVQGVSWDPQDVYLTTLSSDRSLRVFSTRTKKVVHNVQKATIPQAKANKEVKPSRIFYDDTLKSFCRRLAFSPDGELLVAPSGIIEQDEGKISNSVYVFSRSRLNEPVYYLPTGSTPSIAVRFCPLFFKLRSPQGDKDEDGTDLPQSLWRLPYRMVFAVATQDAVLLYDTQQSAPFGHISNIHYARLSDLTWSPDGQILIASSTDGFCSIITFAKDEIGEVYEGDLPHLSANKSPTLQIEPTTSPTAESNTPERQQEDVAVDMQPLDEIDKRSPDQSEKMDHDGAASCPMEDGDDQKTKRNEMSQNETKPNICQKPPRRVQLITLSSKCT
ncbi:chromatin assembly factor 1 subunit B-like isoform X2 [Ornithodoros turicata]|uniref:chromatin assembly factor 1 subunit B-like isoform X2 n=1 Tax=Ornithodoros turicata TaxID=34597 RepID=UPI003138845F